MNLGPRLGEFSQTGKGTEPQPQLSTGKEVRRHNSVYTPWRTTCRFPSGFHGIFGGCFRGSPPECQNSGTGGMGNPLFKLPEILGFLRMFLSETPSWKVVRQNSSHKEHSPASQANALAHGLRGLGGRDCDPMRERGNESPELFARQEIGMHACNRHPCITSCITNCITKYRGKIGVPEISTVAVHTNVHTNRLLLAKV
jgi:hypothetical protein